jgi:hypothetical protein
MVRIIPFTETEGRFSEKELTTLFCFTNVKFANTLKCNGHQQSIDHSCEKIDRTDRHKEKITESLKSGVELHLSFTGYCTSPRAICRSATYGRIKVDIFVLEGRDTDD